MPRCRTVPILLLAATQLFAQSTTPAPIVGQMPAPGLESAAGPSNILAGSYSVSTAYDDNLLNTSSHRLGGRQYFLAASLALQQTREHWKWNLSYRPNLSAGTQAWGSQLNQRIGTTLEVNLTRRTSVQLAQDYMATTNPFDRFTSEPPQPASGPLEPPNDVVVVPPLKRTVVFSAAGVTYRLSRHTVAGIAGSYASQRYANYTSVDWRAPLLNSRAATGGAFVVRQLSRRHSSGVEYLLLDLRFPGREMGTRTHSVLWFQQFVLTGHNSVVIFAGPEYSRSRQPGEGWWGVPPPARAESWSPALGVVYTYGQEHSSLQASYTQRIHDGGGYIGAVTMHSASLSVRRQIARRWTAALSLEGAQETTVFDQQGSRLRVLRSGIRLNRQLRAGLLCGLAYDRLYQRGRLLGYASGNHNRVMFTLEHSFAKPLGR